MKVSSFSWRQNTGEGKSLFRRVCFGESLRPLQELNLCRTNYDDASKHQSEGCVFGCKVISQEVDVLCCHVQTASGISQPHMFVRYLIVSSVELYLIRRPRLSATSPVRSDCMELWYRDKYRGVFLLVGLSLARLSATSPVCSDYMEFWYRDKYRGVFLLVGLSPARLSSGLFRLSKLIITATVCLAPVMDY
jgi:hypothetical protein